MASRNMMERIQTAADFLRSFFPGRDARATRTSIDPRGTTGLPKPTGPRPLERPSDLVFADRVRPPPCAVKLFVWLK
jgi:hypothetical protein